MNGGHRRVARECFPGPLTSCHTHLLNFEQEPARPDHWFYDLDFLQTSFYHRAADAPGSSVEEMEKKLLPVRDLYRRMAKLYGKPIMFGKCGCTSSTGGATAPSGWSGDGRYSPMEQANYLQAVWNLFHAEEYFRGLYWWKWDEQNPRTQFCDDPAGDKGFILDGKPAAEVMKQCFRRPGNTARFRE